MPTGIVGFLMLLSCPPLLAASEDANLHAARGRLAYGRNDYQAARSHLQRALRARPHKAGWAYLLGLAALRLGDKQQAVKHLGRAARLKPANGLFQLAYGISELARGNLFFGARALKGASTLKLKSAILSYYLGYSLYRMGAHRAAIDALRTAVGDNRLASKARYYLGMAQMKLRKFKAAREALAAALPGLGRAHSFAADKIIGYTYRAALKSSLFSAVLGLEGGYDSNVIFDPEGSGTATGSSPNKDAGLLGLRITLALSPIRDGRNLLRGELTLFRNMHSNSVADDFNRTTADAGISYSRRFNLWGLDHQLTVGYRFALACLDGGPRTDRRGFYVFSETHRGLLRYNMDPLRWLSLSAQYQAGVTRFSDLRRDRFDQRVLLGPRFDLAGKLLKLFLNFTLRHDNASGRGYDMVAPGFFLGLAWRAPLELDLAFILSWERADYDDSAGYFTPQELSRKRVDDSTVFAVMLSRAFGRFRAAIQFTRTVKKSRVPVFAYNRNEVSFTFEGRF